MFFYKKIPPQISLVSMHKYQPVIYLYRVPALNSGGGSSSINNGLQLRQSAGAGRSTLVQWYAPHETQFIAVTAYQNEDVIRLKVFIANKSI